MEDLRIEDGSNDRMYFTMVPNYILNHSTAIDQALYLQMKRFAGEKNGGGYCTASKRTLLKKMGVGPKALNTSLKYLVEHKWIENVGARKVMTDGGAQDVQIYRVNDIWKQNTEYYQGANERTPLLKQGADERSKGANESASSKNYTKNKELGSAEPLQVVLEGKEDKPKSSPKYPHSKEVFSWFPKPEKNWAINTTELQHAELLFERGRERVVKALIYCDKHREDDRFYQITKPSDLERKWNDIAEYARRNK